MAQINLINGVTLTECNTQFYLCVIAHRAFFLDLLICTREMMYTILFSYNVNGFEMLDI